MWSGGSLMYVFFYLLYLLSLSSHFILLFVIDHFGERFLFRTIVQVDIHGII